MKQDNTCFWHRQRGWDSKCRLDRISQHPPCSYCRQSRPRSPTRVSTSSILIETLDLRASRPQRHSDGRRIRRRGATDRRGIQQRRQWQALERRQRKQSEGSEHRRRRGSPSGGSRRSRELRPEEEIQLFASKFFW